MILDSELLDELSPESERDFRQCFIEDPASGEIRFTRKGFAEFGPRFAKAGIDINCVHTRAALREASIASEWVLWDEIRQMVKGHKALEDVLKPLWS